MLLTCRIALGRFPGCSVPNSLPTHPSALAYGAPGSCPPGPSPGPAASPSEDLEAKSGPLESAGDVGRGGEGRASSGLDLVSRPLPVVHCHRLSHQLCYIRPSGWTAGERKTWTPQLRSPAQDTVSPTPTLLSPSLHPTAWLSYS